MTYSVVWDSGAARDLKKIDIQNAKKIISKITSYLATDPVGLGKHLSKQFKGLMRYRFGNYRVVYEINEADNIIVIIKIGHRKDVYKR